MTQTFLINISGGCERIKPILLKLNKSKGKLNLFKFHNHVDDTEMVFFISQLMIHTTTLQEQEWKINVFITNMTICKFVYTFEMFKTRLNAKMISFVTILRVFYMTTLTIMYLHALAQPPTLGIFFI